MDLGKLRKPALIALTCCVPFASTAAGIVVIVVIGVIVAVGMGAGGQLRRELARGAGHVRAHAAAATQAGAAAGPEDIRWWGHHGARGLAGGLSAGAAGGGRLVPERDGDRPLAGRPDAGRDLLQGCVCD